METTHQLNYGNGDVVSAVGTANDVNEIEDVTEEEETPIPYEYDISSYGADFPVDSLVRRIKNGDIVVPIFGRYSGGDEGQITGFQRNYVWSKLKADRFIESLLLGLPVPGIFLVRDKNNYLLVLDGQQRLKALQNFYDEANTEKKYRLHKVHPKFEGKSYYDLDPIVRRRLDDSIIHATVVRQLDPKDDQSSIYDIFERLNTGGVNLQPQEIRVALYHGELAQVLSEFNENPNWRSLYGRKKSNRLKDLEMILRFFAFYYSGDEYRRPMKDFLNKYMSKNRNLGCQNKDELERVFRSTTSFLKDCVGEEAFKPFGSLNAAVLDSVMVGVAKRIECGSIGNCNEVKNKLQGLFKNEAYVEAVKTGTSEEGKVGTRQKLALEALADIQ